MIGIRANLRRLGAATIWLGGLSAAHATQMGMPPNAAGLSPTDEGKTRWVSLTQSIAPISEDPSSSSWHIVRHQLSDAELAAPIDFQISLRMRNLAGLESRIHAGQHVSKAEMEANYLPSKADYNNLVLAQLAKATDHAH